jgi:hypothetical protein
MEKGEKRAKKPLLSPAKKFRTRPKPQAGHYGAGKHSNDH